MIVLSASQDKLITGKSLFSQIIFYNQAQTNKIAQMHVDVNSIVQLL